MEHIININLFFNPEEVEIGDEVEVEGGEEISEDPQAEADAEEVEAELEPEPVELIEEPKVVEPEKPQSKIVPATVKPNVPLSTADKQPLKGPQVPHTKVPAMSHIKSMEDLIKMLAQGK